MLDVEALRDVSPSEWPEDVGESICRILQDRERAWTDRLLAAALAENYRAMNDAVARTAVRVAEDQDEALLIRLGAVGTLGTVQSVWFAELQEDYELTGPVIDEVQEALRRLYEDEAMPGSLRRRLMEAASGIDEDWHDEAIRAAYYDGDRLWRAAALRCMAGSTKFEAEIMESLESTDPLVLRRAVETAGLRGLQAAWPRIHELLHAPDVDRGVLEEAISAAAWIRDDGDTLSDDLRHILESGDDEMIETVLLELLLSGYDIFDPEGGYPRKKPET